mmetsp:Transcript_101987/g.266093  ORF Transcript_101987/g.266093 Transcript_101987/m.266093 type:complete len:261 (+) Transcript_101987:1475-2257(+)
MGFCGSPEKEAGTRAPQPQHASKIDVDGRDRDRAVAPDLPHSEALPAGIAPVAAPTAHDPLCVRLDGDTRLVGGLAAGAEVRDAAGGVVAEGVQEPGGAPEVVRRVVREDHHGLLPRVRHALVEQLHARLRTGPHVVQALEGAARLEAVREHDLVGRAIAFESVPVLKIVEVQPHELDAQLWVRVEVACAWHLEVLKIILIVVRLSALLVVRGARARVLAVVVIAVHAVPGDAAKLQAVHPTPLLVPLVIVLAIYALGVK